MVWWWFTAALAQSAGFVGFSEAGRVATYVTLEPSSVGHVATVRSVNVSQGTWNHLPSRAEATTSAEAIDEAYAAFHENYAVRGEAPVRATALGFWREGARTHDHSLPHVVSYRIRTPTGVAVAELVEQPGLEGCPEDAVDASMWLRWGETHVDLLADRRPRRWPRCALSFDLEAVWGGPRGALAGVVRVIALDASGEVVIRRLLVSRRGPA